MSTTLWTQIPNQISRLTNDESRRVPREFLLFSLIVV